MDHPFYCVFRIVQTKTWSRSSSLVSRATPRLFGRACVVRNARQRGEDLAGDLRLDTSALARALGAPLPTIADGLAILGEDD